MLLPPHLHPHHRHHRRHTHRHPWFPGQTSRVQLWAVVAGWQWGWHRALRFRHLHLGYPRCPLASGNAVCPPCNCCLSGCLGQCFRSQAPEVLLRKSYSQEELHCQHALLPRWWPQQALGSPPVGSDAWLSQACFCTPSVGSSPVVCSRYSSRMYTCLQCQARFTTCNRLPRSRMRSYHGPSSRWSISSDQVCPLSALTWTLSDEHLCSFATPREHGAMRCR